MIENFTTILSGLAEVLEARLRKVVREELDDQPISDQGVAKELQITVRTWRSWYRADPELQKLGIYTQPRPGAKRGKWVWSRARIRRWSEAKQAESTRRQGERAGADKAQRGQRRGSR